jgi:K+-transporting ATPase ATPase C chain
MHAASTLDSKLETAQDAATPHPLWGTSIRFTLAVTLLFGIIYPLAVTGIAKVLFPHQATGSLTERNGQVIGSELLAQGFTSDRYFHPRPSAAGTGYDATASGGSNLAQSNSKLVARMQGDIDKLSRENPAVPVPIDLVTTSGSGLDPDITPDAAYFQAPRIARARRFTEQQVRQLIAEHITGRQFGILGEPRVNVLALNLALDNLAH